MCLQRSVVVMDATVDDQKCALPNRETEFYVFAQVDPDEIVSVCDLLMQDMGVWICCCHFVLHYR